MKYSYSAGIGYDIHRLVRGRRLVIGGIEIPFDFGLKGYSDADVLIHSIVDAILGASGLGDIGLYFPDTDPKYKDIDSTEILRRTKRLIQSKGFEIVNIDATVIAERPRLDSYRKAITENLSKILGMKSNCVNLKAKTNEGLGLVGEVKAIASISVVVLRSPMIKRGG